MTAPKTPTPRQQFLLNQVQLGNLTLTPRNCMKALYEIQREPIRYPRVQRQPSWREMQALLDAGWIHKHVNKLKVARAGRIALRKVPG